VSPVVVSAAGDRPIRANSRPASAKVAASTRNSAVVPKAATTAPPSASNTMSSPSVTVASTALARERCPSFTRRGTRVACIGAITSAANINTGTTAKTTPTVVAPVAAASGNTRTTTPCTSCEPTSNGRSGSRSTTGPARIWRSHGSRRTALVSPVRAVEPLSS
jgi:hypothetical protein